MSRTQEQRRAETRRRLLDGARSVVADRGVAGASVEAMAGAADRTSGALYDHFGDKDGIIVALLDEWKEATAAATQADLTGTDDPDERLRSLWANFAVPRAAGGQQWMLLEHELWLYACRQPEATGAAADRYAEVRSRLAESLAGGLLQAGAERSPDQAAGLATLVIGLMVGLEMQRRLEPDAVPDDLAVAGLRALIRGAGGLS
ncbi:MAG: TetR/AcrR family transcriptional regulator [Acidimicrobiales bacterium]